MIKARHHFYIYPFFQRYTLRKLRKKFSGLELVGEFYDDGLPVLLLANHISWWDGFWAMYLNLKVLHRKFHFMMLESQLKKHWYFNHSGGFSVRRNSRSIIESLDYTSELLSDPKNMVLLFPQGELHSLYDTEVRFEKGLKRILQNTDTSFKIVFSANLPEYFDNPRPALYLHHKTYHGEYTFEAIEQSYNAFFREVITYHKNIDRR